MDGTPRVGAAGGVCRYCCRSGPASSAFRDTSASVRARPSSKRDLRIVTEIGPNPANVGPGKPHVADTRIGAWIGLKSVPSNLFSAATRSSTVMFARGANVIDVAGHAGRLGRLHQRLHGVGHVGEVARLQAVAVNGRPSYPPTWRR